MSERTAARSGTEIGSRAAVSPRRVPSHLFVTDLDGTLLDHETYSWQLAAPALTELRERKLPLVLASSKTVAELVELRRELGLDTPMIAENGAVIALPKDAPEGPAAAGLACEGEALGDVRLFALGAARAEFLPALHELRRECALPFRGFADWTDAEVAARTGLALPEARRARDRHGSEPLLWEGDGPGLTRFRVLLAERGLELVQGGRFHHVSAGSDKGRALGWLRRRFESVWPAGTTVVALGDSPNDAAMLDAADVAVVVPARTPRAFAVAAPRVVRPERPGPAGWCDAVLEILRARGE